jgi:cell division protein FtsL
MMLMTTRRMKMTKTTRRKTNRISRKEEVWLVVFVVVKYIFYVFFSKP